MDGLFHLLPGRFLNVFGRARGHDTSCVERARVRLYCLDFLRDLAAEGGGDIVRGVRAKVERKGRAGRVNERSEPRDG